VSEGRDLHIGPDGRTYLVPTTHALQPGPIRLRRIDGVQVSATQDELSRFEVSRSEAEAFQEVATQDAVQRVGVALGALGDLIAAANDPSHLDEPPESLDRLAGLDGSQGAQARAASQMLGGLQKLLAQAQDDPESLRALGAQVAERWQSDDAPEVSASIEQAVEALLDRTPR